MLPTLTSGPYRISVSYATIRSRAAMLDAYGWPHACADDEILAWLLALNLERAVAQGGAVDVKAESFAG